MHASAQSFRWLRDRRVLPVAIVLLGLVLNLYRIDAQSLWDNEAFSVSASAQPTAAMRDIVIRDFVHPPLHYYLLHFWMRLLGMGSLQARLLSAMFGTLSIGMIYLLGTYLFDRRTGLLASVILALSQMSIEYSQEARPYAQVLFLALCAAYLLARALRQRSVPLWWAFVLATFAMLFTHYYSVLAAGVMYGYAFLYRRKYELPLSRLIGGVIVVAALFTPWLTSGVVAQALQSRKTLPARLGPWFQVHWWTVGTTINRFNNGMYFGVQGGARWWNYFAGALLLCIPAALAVKPLLHRSPLSGPEADQREHLLFLAGLFAIPLGVALSLGVAVHAQYHPRYVLYTVAPYYLLVARGLVTLESRTWRKTLTVLLLLYSLGSLHALYFVPFKENYRDALGEMARGYRQGDCTIFLPKAIPVLQLKAYPGDPSRLHVVTVDEALHNGGACKRIWAVIYWRAGEIEQAAHRELGKIEQQYEPKELKRFFWVDVQPYVQKPSAARQAPLTCTPNVSC